MLSERLAELEVLTSANADFKDWRERTDTTLRAAMPPDSPVLSRFATVRYQPMMYTSGDNSRSIARAFKRGKDSAASILKAAIFELELAAGDEPEEGGGLILNVAEQKKVEELIHQFRTAAANGELDNLDRDSRAEAEAEVATLESQLRSPRPKRSIVGAALQSLKGILHEAMGAAVGAGLYAAVDAAVHLIH